jgi:hypothetical protein
MGNTGHGETFLYWTRVGSIICAGLDIGEVS